MIEMDVWKTVTFVILAPFVLYLLVRIVSVAVFHSWFEVKKEQDKRQKQ